MFSVVKGFKKEDLKFVAEELGVTIPSSVTVAGLKKLIEESEEHKNDPNFVQELLVTAIAERQEKMELEKQQQQLELEKEKARMNHELEMAKIQAQRQGESVPSNFIADQNNSKRKFTLPRLEFRQFGDNIKDWLPFWSQFEQIHNDDDIALEDKFQYLIQATVAGSRAREVVESFPPIGANYSKAVESLKSRFGREDILVEVYVRELLKLIISAQTKEKFSLTSLYDKLESYLRALETLGVTTDKCASILYPLVESCFPADFLKAWNRSNISNSSIDAKERLNNLMQFLKTEVEGEERISLAVAGFGLGKSQDHKMLKRKNYSSDHLRNKISTAAGLLANVPSSEVKKLCIFCEGKHKSTECFTAQKLSLAEKQKIVKEKRCCFVCLLPGHTVKKCRAILRCVICFKKHVPLMCDVLEAKNKVSDVKEEKSPRESDVNLSNFNKNVPKVFLQTLKAKLVSEGKEKIVRLLFDSGSHKSYILKRVALEMKYSPRRQEKIKHTLFGGITTKEVSHNCYKIKLKNLNGKYGCNFDALDQTTICENIRPVFKGNWFKELAENKIFLTDIGENCEAIDILIGADIMGKLLTGRKKVLSSGLVAIETYLGWTLMGKVPEEETFNENLAMTVTSLLVNEADISYLWRLDLLGINDPIEKKSRYEIDLQTKEHFLETVTVNDDGRYEICLPWGDDVSRLPDNLNLAKKRLDYTTSKLLSINLYEEYENIFLNWIEEGVIEEVPPSEISSYGNYLPHRPVIKLSSSTTPIRPVFDASARLANFPSLNQCLECGPNMIELIPDILLRFREKEIGVIADIRKAFLQISVRKEDRDFLRFLWWENLKEKKLKIYRHARVVFGVKCSPFLLASVIEYHIDHSENHDTTFKEKLKQSFYVDNVVTSVENIEELEKFKHDSRMLMAKGCFDLRQWEYSGDCKENKDKTETHVLGLLWNKELDTLKIDMDWVNNLKIEKITKRSILSTVHKTFDPFGFACPVMLYPKIMLQKAWKLNINWDEEVTEELRSEFLQWFQDLKYLKDIQISRFILLNRNNLKNCTLHTFVDGSKVAYGTVIFLRIEEENETKLIFLAARSRVAPLRGTTIPRMELLAALIGARLTHSIIKALDWINIKRYYWTDSTTVLAWILREENWSVFVRNRVNEIRKLSDCQSWNHVPGDKNPADITSRGCRAKHFNSLKWWEGPKWLKVRQFCNIIDSTNHSCNEEEIEMEKLKSVCMLSNNEVNRNTNWYYKYFSCYEKIIRLVAWILRFKNNSLNPKNRLDGELTVSEFREAELKILAMIQQESFSSENDDRLKSLETYKDDQGIIRLKTRLIYRKDTEDFLNPVILPSKHEVVQRLIFNAHIKNCHAGVQILLNILRERYWILNGRKTVKQVVENCVKCKRFSSKNIEAKASPLPENRVKDAAVFQITGIDMAGPLYLKENKKSWVLIFTCAVYRAVHLELVTSASTDAFLMAFRRFVARRGRCSVIYSDNGSNFVGANNSLKKLEWNRIQRYATVNSIEWKFNPPTAAWWGGWWERLVRIMKDLLKRVLGRASLNYEEMATILADCESVINSRPLTYICENEAVKPICPSMFLQDEIEYRLPDIDAVEQKSLSKRLKYRQTLHKDLRNRFRSEYLGSLILHKNKKTRHRSVSVGDIVLVGADNRKRIDWPIGRVSKVIPGKDGNVRLVKVQTSHQELLRPVQRIYPFEISSSDCPKPKTSSNDNKDQPIVNKNEMPRDEQKSTKSGRRIMIPDRFTF